MEAEIVSADVAKPATALSSKLDRMFFKKITKFCSRYAY
jgi:hypothetical protein